MTISELTVGDTVTAQAATITKGAAFGRSHSFADGTTYSNTCRVETLTAREIEQFAARGQARTHNVYFSSDPGLSNNDRLKWTATHNSEITLSPARYLRVHSTEFANSPDGDLRLWIVTCEQITVREDS